MNANIKLIGNHAVNFNGQSCCGERDGARTIGCKPSPDVPGAREVDVAARIVFVKGCGPTDLLADSEPFFVADGN